MYAVVNIYNEPVNNHRYSTYEEAEKLVLKDWAEGYETYVARIVEDRVMEVHR